MLSFFKGERNVLCFFMDENWENVLVTKTLFINGSSPLVNPLFVWWHFEQCNSLLVWKPMYLRKEWQYNQFKAYISISLCSSYVPNRITSVKDKIIDWGHSVLQHSNYILDFFDTWLLPLLKKKRERPFNERIWIITPKVSG